MATTLKFHVTTVRHWRRLFRKFILPLESIPPKWIIKKRMIFDMMDLSLKRKSKSGRHLFCAPTMRNNTSKASCFLFWKTKFLSYLTGQRNFFGNKVSREANKVVCKERHKLAYLQCHFQDRLLRSPVEQLWPGLVRCSLVLRATHECHKKA